MLAFFARVNSEFVEAGGAGKPVDCSTPEFSRGLIEFQLPERLHFNCWSCDDSKIIRLKICNTGNCRRRSVASSNGSAGWGLFSIWTLTWECWLFDTFSCWLHWSNVCVLTLNQVSSHGPQSRALPAGTTGSKPKGWITLFFGQVLQPPCCRCCWGTGLQAVNLTHQQVLVLFLFQNLQKLWST